MGGRQAAQVMEPGTTSAAHQAGRGRVWVIFDWDEKGWQSFVSDPEVPPILKEAGHNGRPQVAKLGGRYGA